jgi:uncharacterized protein YjaZ
MGLLDSIGLLFTERVSAKTMAERLALQEDRHEAAIRALKLAHEAAIQKLTLVNERQHAELEAINAKCEAKDKQIAECNKAFEEVKDQARREQRDKHQLQQEIEEARDAAAKERPGYDAGS